MTECYFCHEPIGANPQALTDPWGRVYAHSHEHCLADYDGPSDEQLESLAERTADAQDREARTLEDAGR